MRLINEFIEILLLGRKFLFRLNGIQPLQAPHRHQPR